MLFVFNGRSYSLCAPRSFRHVLYNVEVLQQGETGADVNVAPAAFRATYQADGIRAMMTLYVGDQELVRFDVKNTGKLRWAP